MSTFARLSVSLRAVLEPERHGRARRALDQRGRLVRGLAGQRLAVDADDHVAHLQPALLGRRVVVDLLDAQALLDLAAPTSRRPRTGPRCRAGSSCSPSARSSARTGPAATRPRRRATCSSSCLAIDLAVVVALDRVDRLLVEAPVAVGDQRVAREARERVRVAAEPDAQHEGERDQDGEESGP